VLILALGIGAVLTAQSGCDDDVAEETTVEPSPATFSGPVSLLPVSPLNSDLIRTTNVRAADFPTLGGPSIVVSEILPTDMIEGKADHPAPPEGSRLTGAITILDQCSPACATRQIVGFAKLPVRTHVVDFDGDADNDIVVADLGAIATIDTTLGRILLLRNRGGGDFHPEVIAEGLGRVACAEAADLDADGDLDIVGCVFGHLNGGLIWLEQTESMVFETHSLDPRAGYIHAFPLDIDGDGDLDIPAVLSQESEEVVLFRGAGDGTFEKEIIFNATDPCYGMSGLEPVDFDADGDIDLLVTNGDMFDAGCQRSDVASRHGLELFTNNGAGQFERRRLADFYAAYSVRAADFDGDGDVDFVLSSQQEPLTTLPGSPNEIIWYENQGDEFSPHPLDGGQFSAISLELADMNGDGRVDLLTGSMDIRTRTEGQRLGLFLNQPRTAAAP
jgi:hypothetical protein